MKNDFSIEGVAHIGEVEACTISLIATSRVSLGAIFFIRQSDRVTNEVLGVIIDLEHGIKVREMLLKQLLSIILRRSFLIMCILLRVGNEELKLTKISFFISFYKNYNAHDRGLYQRPPNNFRVLFSSGCSISNFIDSSILLKTRWIFSAASRSVVNKHTSST